MAIAKVGSSVEFSTTTANIGTGGQDMTIAPTAGNTIVVVAYFRGSTSTTCTVTPTGGAATFTSRVAQLGGSTYLHIVTAHNVGAGITKVNVAPNVAARGQIWVTEYSGVDNSTPMDVTEVSGTLGTTTTKQSPSFSPVTPGSVVIAAWGHSGSSDTSSPYKATTAGPTAVSGTEAGAGWTEERDFWNQNVGSSNHNTVIASNVVVTPGTYQAQWTSAVTTNGPVGAIALRPLADAVDPTKFFAIL